MAYVSGCIPFTPAMKLVEGGIEEQTEQAMNNLFAVVKAAGSEPSHILKCTIFMKDMNNFEKINAIYEKRFAPYKPARSAVEVGPPAKTSASRSSASPPSSPTSDARSMSSMTCSASPPETLSVAKAPGNCNRLFLRSVADMLHSVHDGGCMRHQRSTKRRRNETIRGTRSLRACNEDHWVCRLEDDARRIALASRKGAIRYLGALSLAILSHLASRSLYAAMEGMGDCGRRA